MTEQTAVAIIGAHGKIGQLLARELTGRGYRVLGVHRKAEQVAAVEATGAVSVLHDLECGTAEQLAAALTKGSDGAPWAGLVFTAGAGTGSGPIRKETVDLGGSLQSIEAAGLAGIGRFVQVSFIGADREAEPTGNEGWDAYRRAKRDADVALRDSGLDWSIVAPGHLTDEPASGSVTLGEGLDGGDVSRGNVALVIAEVLGAPGTLRRTLDVVDGTTPVRDAVSAS
ncbi:MAG: NAD(P)H-binding protein [Actinomycetales bacterium]|nr:NAD(P)H-binding protein [Actinomycetales bacterium]